MPDFPVASENVDPTQLDQNNNQQEANQETNQQEIDSTPPPEEQFVDQMYDKLQSKLVGFDPTIIMSIITALIQIFSNKKQNNVSLEDMQACYNRKPRLLKLQLRNKLIHQQVPVRQLDTVIDAALSLDPKPEDFQKMNEMVDNLI